MSSAQPVTITDFKEEVIDSTVPVIVDFWAEWCGPCKSIAPILDKLADEYGSKIKVRKVDIDDQRELGTKYNVESIPTLMFFSEGKIVDQLVGARPAKDISARIDKILTRSEA